MKKKPFTSLGGTSGRVRPRGASGPSGPKLNLRQAPVKTATPKASVGAPKVGPLGFTDYRGQPFPGGSGTKRAEWMRQNNDYSRMK